MCRDPDAVDGENSDGRVSMSAAFENGFFSEVLVEYGHITYCIGKRHVTRGAETGMAAWEEAPAVGSRVQRPQHSRPVRCNRLERSDDGSTVFPRARRTIPSWRPLSADLCRAATAEGGGETPAGRLWAGTGAPATSRIGTVPAQMSEARSAGSSSGSPLRTFADERGEDLGCGKLFGRWPADVGRSSGQDVDVVHRPPEAGTSDDETVEVGDRATRRGGRIGHEVPWRFRQSTRWA